MIMEPDKNNAQNYFAEDGLRLFKPAKHVVVKVHESIYKRLDEKYNLPGITDRIAASIDKLAEQENRKCTVVLYDKRSDELLTFDDMQSGLVIRDISMYDHEVLYGVICRELATVGGYHVYTIHTDVQRLRSQFTIEW